MFAVTGESCLPGQIAAGRSFPSGSTVSCDAPHDVEVFESFDLFGPQRELPFPGRERFDDYGGKACTLVFDSALVTGGDKDRLEAVALVPAQAEFERRVSSGFADRDVICALRAADGSQLTGTRIAEDR